MSNQTRAAIVLPWRARISSLGTAIIGLLVALGIVTAAHLLIFPDFIDAPQPDGIFKYLPYLDTVSI